MHTFFARHRSVRRSTIGRVSTARAGERPRPGRPWAGSEDGFTLIEVVVSTLIVGLVTIATFAGFDVLGKADADQRHHNEATVIAAQSQEALRSDPALALDELINAGGHTYTQTVQGTKYTVSQTAAFQSGSGGTATCNAAAAHASETSYYIRVSSSVRWSVLGKSRPAVTETSIITPPIGSALEVDVTNGGTPELNVAGVTVFSEGAETTTGVNGCVIYNGIPATTANVEAYKHGWVTKGGEHSYIAKEVSIAPNVITHVEVQMAQAGAITAKFLYKGLATWEREVGKPATLETVKGDTFVAFNNQLHPTPESEVGSTRFEFNAAGEYAPVPEKYEATATTPIEPTNYPYGTLFPFEVKQKWSVYAGDCAKNSSELYGVTPGSVVVTAGNDVSVSVPMSYVAVNVYEKLKTTEGLTTKSPYPVKITNVSCTTPLSPLPNNAYKATYNTAYKATYAHANTTTAEAHLTQPFQPFGKFSLCLYNEAAKKTYTATYTNSTVAGSKVNIFLGAGAGTTTEGAEATKVEVTVATGQLTNTC
jgi:type II secretory pathway pseudopilin PulG